VTAISAQTFGPADPSLYEDADANEMSVEEFEGLLANWEAEGSGRNGMDTAPSMNPANGGPRVIGTIKRVLLDEDQAGDLGQEGMVVRREPGELIGSGRRYIPPANRFFA